ncbi:sodium:solute symporter [Arthrobacter sp. PAMC25284]|uniref:sodium:solute symporter family protein n=1 Tax=Arthrobacter sp. PAMC25284 TaxID=2861279 RepID=UPI001C63B5AF|nr:hypothetical protein [Arthrobacter sp. PAMC25284]QYF89556.1 hypothetical protein KY499_16040 [Arthrobacter sp. PAMC25284]
MSVSGPWVVLAASVVIVVLLFIVVRRFRGTKDQVLVADRSVGVLTGGLSVAAAWVWAPALFVSSQKAYESGVAGLFWFALPNALALVLFAFIAHRARTMLPQGYTLPEFTRHRLGTTAHRIYMGVEFIVQTYAVIVQFTACLLLLQLLTGMDRVPLLIVVAALFAAIATTRGIRSSITVDVAKAGMIAVLAILIVPLIASSHGALGDGLGGLAGTVNPLDPALIWTFGIPISISLLSGITVDQQQWQRAFSMRQATVRRTFLWGALLFAAVPIVLGIPGFVAAGGLAPGDITNTQLSGFHAVAAYLPGVGVAVFAFAVVFALAAAGASALSAAGSVGGVDLYKGWIRLDASDVQVARASRITMIVIVLIGLGVALIPNVQVLYLLLLVGSIRAAFMVPTLLMLFWPRLTNAGALAGITSGMVVGLPVFILGSTLQLSTLQTFGVLLPVVISAVVSLVVSLFRRRDGSIPVEGRPAAADVEVP